MHFWIGLLLGIPIGSTLGIGLFALVIAGKKR